jgi:hypothetical protein
MSSVKIITEWYGDLPSIVGKGCMRYPKRAEIIVKAASEIDEIYSANNISFIAAPDNLANWDLGKVWDFLRVAEELDKKFRALFALCLNEKNEKGILND